MSTGKTRRCKKVTPKPIGQAKKCDLLRSPGLVIKKAKAMLRIHLSRPRSRKSEAVKSQADKYAIRYGLITAVLIVVYNLVIEILGEGGFELAHIAIFAILFIMIGFGMHKSRKWIRTEHAMDDRMLFGLVLSIATALGVIALNGLLVIIDYHLLVSETFVSIKDGWKFAVNSMALFWSCLIFGFLSAFIFSEIYTKR